MSEGLEGGCACGEVRYRLCDAPMFVHCCHCRECQRLSGGGFAVNALIEAERVEALAGAPEPVPVTGASGRPQQIFRCRHCRVAVWSTYPGMGPAILFVRAGTLDAPERIRPDVHIYTATKLPWLSLPASVPSFEDFYRIADLWPPESFRRLQEARGQAGSARPT